MNAPADLPVPAPAQGWPGTAVLSGVVLGTALQLQQGALWAWPAYGAAAAAGLLALAWAGWSRRAARWPPLRTAAALLGAAAVAGALCGLRALVFLASALAPSLEGRDLQVTGVVAAMPQLRESGLRLRLAVESAHGGGQPVALPGLIDLAWYATGQGATRAGRRRPCARASAGASPCA